MKVEKRIVANVLTIVTLILYCDIKILTLLYRIVLPIYYIITLRALRDIILMLWWKCDFSSDHLREKVEKRNSMCMKKKINYIVL